ncbi:hypothetical protein [Leclercia pneumoniae]|uniref:hypothetical protein n=1 Tax=Leclercia pneumoniae TaxID=2815358 RepID=UPI001BA9FEC4|nr:hypothetical protein [Enterobacter sp. JGM127]
MVNLDKHPGFILRYLHVQYISCQGLVTFCQPILVAELEGTYGLYYAIFADSGIGLWMNKHTFEKTCLSVSEAELIEPSYLSWRQQKALGFRKNQFQI